MATSLGEGAPGRSRWRHISPEAKWSLRIDYIFHNAAAKTLRGHAVQEGPSDHAMVWSDLKFAPAAASQPTTQR